MPSIREGVPEYPRSNPISIPHGKSKARHDDWAESSIDDRDSTYGSLSRVTSNASSGRRDSVSSYTSSQRRPSAVSIDDDEKDVNGLYGWSNSGQKYGRRDSYPMPVARLDDKRDIDGVYGFSHGDSRHKKKDDNHRSSGFPQSDSRHKKGDDINGIYGWAAESRHGEYRYHDVPEKGARRHHK
jgi:hypothetical protein